MMGKVFRPTIGWCVTQCIVVVSVPFLSEMTRAQEWDSVVTCHAGFHSAQTWNMHNHAIGKHKLRSLHKAAKPLVMMKKIT